MKKLIISVLILTVQIKINYCQNVFTDSLFQHIVLTYINKYSEVPNKCNAKPLYGITFNIINGELLFIIETGLGRPGSIPPLHPDSVPSENPLVRKGVAFIDKIPVVFFDFKKSSGHGLYDTFLVSNKNNNQIPSIPDGCGNVWYPESWIYCIIKDSIYFRESIKSYQLK